MSEKQLTAQEILNHLLNFDEKEGFALKYIANDRIPLDEPTEQRWMYESNIQVYERFAIEEKLTNEEKLQFLDASTNGKMSAALKIAEAFVDKILRFRSSIWDIISVSVWRKFMEEYDPFWEKGNDGTFFTPYRSSHFAASYYMFANDDFDKVLERRGQNTVIKMAFGRVLNENILDCFLEDAFHYHIEHFIEIEKYYIVKQHQHQSVKLPNGRETDYDRACKILLNGKYVETAFKANGYNLGTRKGENGEEILSIYEEGMAYVDREYRDLTTDEISQFLALQEELNRRLKQNETVQGFIDKMTEEKAKREELTKNDG